MKIAVIGSKGVVGSTLVEHLSRTGNTVIPVDRHGTASLEHAARQADVVFIVTLPIREVGSLINRAVKMMHYGGIIIHGTSIEHPRYAKEEIDKQLLLNGNLTLCHLHFHFRPEIPLFRTLRGQKVSVSYLGSEIENWKPWVEKTFAVHLAKWHEFRAGNEHDGYTTISQLCHMLIAVLVSTLWASLPKNTLLKGLALGGPPCRLLMRTVLRTAQAPRVVAEILCSHPMAMPLIEKLENATRVLKQGIERGYVGELVDALNSARQQFGKRALKEIDTSTAMLARLEADFATLRHEYTFPAALNKYGLLINVLQVYRGLEINLTTVNAQNNPDGSCTFHIGMDCTRSAKTERAREAVIAMIRAI